MTTTHNSLFASAIARLSALAFALFLSSGVARAQTVFIVDGSGSTAGSVPEVQDALDLAQDGDTIVVLPGSYLGFVIDNLAVQLVSRGGPAQTRIRFRATVSNLDPGKLVLIRGFRFVPLFFSNDAFLATNNAGELFVEDSEFDGASPIEVVDCSATVFKQCLAKNGAPTLRSIDSELYLFDCTLDGAFGNGALFGGAANCTLPILPSTPGGDALVLSGGSVFASGSSFVGGKGGDGRVCDALSACEPPSDGGAGLLLTGIDPSATYVDCSFLGGVEGTGICMDAWAGLPFEGDTSDLVSLEGVARRLTVTSPVQEGETLQLVVDGTPGQFVRLFISPFGIDPLFYPLASNTIVPIAPHVFVGLGKIPLSGQKTFTITINELGLDVVTLYAQATLKTPAQVGTPFGELTHPTAITLLDGATLTVD